MASRGDSRNLDALAELQKRMAELEDTEEEQAQMIEALQAELRETRDDADFYARLYRKGMQGEA